MWGQIWANLAGQKVIIMNLIIFGTIHSAIAILVQDELLRRVHSVKWIALCCAVKIIIIDCVFQMGLSVDIEHYLAAQWLLMFIKTVHIILYLFAFWYTYEDSIIKSVLISISGELLALAISRGSIILLQNLGSGIEDMYSRPFGWRTVLLCLLCFAMFFCIRFLVRTFCGKKISRFRNQELKHKKFWTVIFFLYIGVGFYQSTLNSLERIFRTYKMGILIVALVLIAAFCLTAWSYRKYQQQIFQEHEFLNIKQNLMMLHMKAVRQQIQNMEMEQQIIDKQMEKIKQIGVFEGTAQIENYVKTIKNQYHKIQAGMYSDDMFVDSVLYYYADIFKRQNLILEISFAKYRKDSLSEMCAGKVLMCLLEAALIKSRAGGQTESTIKLYGGTVKNQVIFRLEYKVPENRRTKERASLQRLRRHSKSRKLCKTLRRCVKQFGGNIRMTEEGNRLKIEIILPEKNYGAEGETSRFNLQQ